MNGYDAHLRCATRVATCLRVTGNGLAGARELLLLVQPGQHTPAGEAVLWVIRVPGATTEGLECRNGLVDSIR
jgi:hypothetical protein